MSSLIAGVYFGLLSVYHADSLMVDVHLAFSRDSIAWRQLGGRAPILTYGLPDSFDSHCIYPLTPLVVGDEIRVYYAAEDEAHPLARQDINLQTHAVSRADVPVDEQSWLRGRHGFGGLATCRRDGFVSLDAGSAPAELVTKAFRCRGDRLVLNADASKGELRVELLDPERFAHCRIPGERLGSARAGFSAPYRHLAGAIGSVVARRQGSQDSDGHEQCTAFLIWHPKRMMRALRCSRFRGRNCNPAVVLPGTRVSHRDDPVSERAAACRL